MTVLRAWRLLTWVTSLTLLLTMAVMTGSILTLGLTQVLFPGSLETHMTSLTHAVQFVLLAFLHSAPVMVSV
ncbi:hypothetical protein MXM41_16005 [Leclercia adecarboxylata]|uniref:hypothetical protein n=1 Tax=Leclercia adecarboxylata TaxID=83655 RepID=UPI002DB7F7E7|nr:hypothetical protein [Leclercia adecarboxylata]MEB6380424.1 hypothetical protein [Leclercia adecarboxylata]